MLLVWFALPGTDMKVIKNDIDTFAGLISSTVGEETVGCAMVTNVALQGVGELGFRLHFVDVADVCMPATKEDLSTGLTTIDGRNVGIDTIR
jgi:hypothetical protein